MELKNNFIKGKLNRDLDERLIPKGEFVNAENINVSESEGSDTGSIENSLGNEAMTNLNLGTNVKTIGWVSDDFTRTIYWLIKSDTVHAVLEWDDRRQVVTEVLRDTRTGSANVLNFNENYLVSGINIIIDSDNGAKFLVWTDNLNPPRKVNIDRAKTFGEDNFTEEDISVIKKAPLNPPALEFTNTSSGDENNLEGKLLFFSYRYVYLDNEYSALAPFSRVAFEPKNFSYDYATTTNKSMVNKWNAVKVKYNTGSRRVKEVQIVYKESGSQNLYLVETINKAAESLGDDLTAELLFSNNKSHTDTVIASNQLYRLYDNVPRKALSQEVVGNRIVYGNYTENYDLLDANGEQVDMDFTLSYNSYSIASGEASPSMKSNRDEEVGIAYLDNQGRMTTVLTSEDNSTFIKNGNANKQNKLQVTINHLPPEFATHYRFFIKKNREDYDTISPLIFYQDGRYTWLRLEGNDVDKVKKGDFLYVKSTAKGILDEALQVEVLDVKAQEENFLEDSTVTSIEQQAGTYMKIKPEGFNLSSSDVSVFRQVAKGFRSRNTRNRIKNPVDYVDAPVYYGSEGLDDISVSGTYSGSTDIRYIVEINGTGSPDTYRWSDDDGATWSATTNCSTTPVAMNNGLSIAFGDTTGHDINDNWIISAKSADIVNSYNVSTLAYVPYQAKTTDDETISEGAVIDIAYREERDGFVVVDYTKSFISNGTYANLEEWFYQDDILGKLEHPTDSTEVLFRRGTPVKDPVETIDMDASENLYMIFRSKSSVYDGARVSVDASIEITEIDAQIIFETNPDYNNSNVYYEWGDTYAISGGYHQSGTNSPDQNQTSTQPAIVELDAFNCFAWSNGYESYKIRDKFTGKAFRIDSRPLSTIPNYRKNVRIASLTYSQPYEQTTNYNGLNEFNLFLENYKDLDDKYGPINKLFGRDTNLIAFQEDKVHNIMVNKSVLFNADGTGNVSQNREVLGQEVPYSGEYGISNDPLGFAFFGNNIWWPDSKRGVICRLGADGITEVSNYGMRDFFRDNLTNNIGGVKIGAYDPYHDRYVLSIKEDTTVTEVEATCGTSIYKSNLTEPFTYTFKVDEFKSEFNVNYEVISGSISIGATYNLIPKTGTGTVTGSGTYTIDKDTTGVNEATITVTPVDTPAAFRISNTCTQGQAIKVYMIVVSDSGDIDGKSGLIKYEVNGQSSSRSIPSYTFTKSGVNKFVGKTGLEGTPDYPADQDTIIMSIYYGESGDSIFDTTKGNRMGYFVSSTEYTASDLDTIVNLATYPNSGSTAGFGDLTHATDPFTYDKATDDDILYLIWDFRNTVVTANDDSVTMFAGKTVTVNVLDNDEYVGEPTVLIVVGPTNGSAFVTSNNEIQYVNDGTTGSDTITYSVSTGPTSSDTADINITVNPDTGGGTGATGESFSMSSSGYSGTSPSDGEGACGFTLNTTKYHNGPNTYPTLDDYVYDDVNKTTPFDGQNKYYRIALGRSIKINSSGRIIDVWICGAGNA